MDIELLVKKQRAYYENGKTRDVSWRIAALKALKKTIVKYEKEIAEALYADLRKSETETYMCETGMVLSELSHMISYLGSYHGRDSFELFSHRRSIVKKYTWIDLPMRYQPYYDWKNLLIKMFLR